MSELDSSTKPWLPEKWQNEADVVIVGYGGAGACAAIEAHDSGVEVLILEKAPFGGGNTVLAGGTILLPTNLADTTDCFRALSWGTADEELIRVFAKAAMELPVKFEALGAEVVRSGYFKHSFGSLPGCQSVNSVWNIKGKIGPALWGFLTKQVESRNIRIVYETPVKELIQDPVTKEILGVKAESSGKYLNIKARKAVLLTCGGFQNNKELIVNFFPYATELPLLPWGTPYNTGDGIPMASEVGAKLWHMTAFETGNFAPKAPSVEFGVAFRLKGTLPIGSSAIFVNKYGKRFMNEAKSLSHRKEPLEAYVTYFDHDHAEFPNIPFYMIFDEAFRRNGSIVGRNWRSYWFYKNLYKWSDDNSAEIEKGWIIQADSIKELAEKIKISSDGLEETIREYNENCAVGADQKFGRAKNWLVPIACPPYYATELCGAITNTHGGPKHNALAQVLNKDDKPIPRLYAAGELGSFHGFLYIGGMNLAETFAFGFIAGKNASNEKPWDKS